MVAIKEVRSANAALKNKYESLTAVFTGSTSGIGLNTIRAFAKHIPKPTAIIVGRSKAKFQSELENLKQINPNGEFSFLEADVSLIKHIDAVCEQIKKQVSSIDLLVTAQGYLSFNGRENNADGLDNSTSLRYYGRVRFAENLLPIMSRNARVISVLGGGKEGKIFEDDLGLERNYSLLTSANQMGSMMSLTFDKLAEQNPEKSFIHTYPGIVNTGLLGKSATGILAYFFGYILEPIFSLFALTPEEVGERNLYYGTNERYAKGCWTVDWTCEPKTVQTLTEYRQRGFADKVMEHNHQVFDRATAA